ncbi:MAG: response regulator [Lachnospiraceae bacterium]|nr:response regulator [Lachnospiraceae bacterium]
MKKGIKKKNVYYSTRLSVSITALIVVCFVGVIIAYYAMLYSEMREKIVKSCELSAQSSSSQIDRYLSVGIDTMKLTCFSLDSMLEEGRSNAEIRDFLVNQTTAVVNLTSENSTGLYGYVRGEYLDGTDWVPDEDYIPTERPWYIDARKALGEVTVVDPYIDEMSHTVLITLSKTLCDGQSVAAIDLSLDELQKITKELTDSGETETEFVLDRNYQVVAHSDISQLGKNYLTEIGTFGHEIVEELQASDEAYFSLKYKNEDYVVYTTPVANNWLCLSVFNATSAFRQLKNMLVMTIITSILVAAILMFIMSRYYKRTKIALELNDKTERAIAANEAKSNFLSNMSHEIRTPINAVLGMNEMILRESRENNVIEYSEKIRTAGNTLLGIVNDILDFSKIEAGKMEIIPAEYDISSIINDLVNMIKTKADNKGLELILDINKNIPKILYGDEVRIKQAVTNILTNAVKYTEKGSVTFSVSYEIIYDELDNVFLTFSVKDTGIGIKEEDLEKLFTEFERIEEKRNRNIEGTGLGMNITRTVLEMMGSTLQVESKYGVGSTFWFKLKQKVIKWDPLGDYEASFHAAISNRKEYRERFTAQDAIILVVDDTETNLDVFRSLLKRTKVRIDTAISGDECLKRSHERKYDMIFLDHMMPHKDGIQTFHELRDEKDNINLKTPTVCLTANAISGAREKYIAEGFDDYLTKPIDAAKLEEMLIRYLPKEKVVMTSDENDGNLGNETETEDVSLPGWLAQCEGIDAAAGVQNCGGPEEYITILTGFHAGISAKADEIENYFNNNDIKNYTVKVHALKSSSRIVGISELSEKARLLEEAGDAGDLDYIRANTEELLGQYRSYIKILSPISESLEDLPEIPADMLADAYAGLSEFAEAKDYELARMVMESVKEYKLPPEDGERFAKLQSCLSQMDWNGIKELLK